VIAIGVINDTLPRVSDANVFYGAVRSFEIKTIHCVAIVPGGAGAAGDDGPGAIVIHGREQGHAIRSGDEIELSGRRDIDASGIGGRKLETTQTFQSVVCT